MRKNLIQIRKKQKNTQLELANRLKITERYYRKLEAGTSNGSIEVWQELKRITGCSIDYLLEQEGDTKEKPDGNQCRVGSSERPTR